MTGQASSGSTPAPWRTAPVSRRLVAGALDAAVLASVGIGVSRVLRRTGFVERGQLGSVLLVALDAAYRIGLTALAGRTLGQLAVRIRVVQHGSGTVPTWRQATLRWAVAAPATFAPSLLPMPRSAKRWTDRMEQVRPQIEELRRRHGQDRHRLNEELLALFQREQLDPAAGCLADLPQAIGSLVYQCAVYLPVLCRPLHQGLHDRVAGTVVVQETPATALR